MKGGNLKKNVKNWGSTTNIGKVPWENVQKKKVKNPPYEVLNTSI